MLSWPVRMEMCVAEKFRLYSSDLDSLIFYIFYIYGEGEIKLNFLTMLWTFVYM